MAYGGLTGFLNVGPDPKEVARLAEMEIEQAIAEGRLRELLEQEAKAVMALMQRAERVDELERQVKNLEYLMSKKVQNYRQELATAVDPLWRFMQRNAESISEFAASEQRSRGGLVFDMKDTDPC